MPDVCECYEDACLHCEGECDRLGTVRLFEKDSDDQTGILLCEGCSKDALESGEYIHSL